MMPDSDFNSKQLQRLRAQLLDLREKLESQLAEDSASRPVELDQQSVGRVSRVDAIQQQQMALANRQQADRSLRLVEHALTRFDRGEYGYCLDCGEPVALARLRAQPFAALCVDCQTRREDR